MLFRSGKLPPDATLWYGFGKDPYCNLRDADDMAVPVFEIKIANGTESAFRSPTN